MHPVSQGPRDAIPPTFLFYAFFPVSDGPAATVPSIVDPLGWPYRAIRLAPFVPLQKALEGLSSICCSWNNKDVEACYGYGSNSPEVEIKWP